MERIAYSWNRRLIEMDKDSASLSMKSQSLKKLKSSFLTRLGPACAVE